MRPDPEGFSDEFKRAANRSLAIVSPIPFRAHKRGGTKERIDLDWVARVERQVTAQRLVGSRIVALVRRSVAVEEKSAKPDSVFRD